jgi:hypothetical protein
MNVEQFTDMRSLVDYLNKTAHATMCWIIPLFRIKNGTALYNQLH